MIALILASMAVTVALALPIITATKSDILIFDNDGDGVADPGDTIRYSIGITNSGSLNATGVDFLDTVDANTTLVPESLRTTPIARNDVYNALGNVGITVPAGSGVLANDNDPDGTTPTLTIVSSPVASVAGGTVSVAGDGSFTYMPPPGFEGTDQFSYIVQDTDGNQDPATVLISVNEMIWFIDNSAPPSGDGRLNTPFNSIAAFNGGAADDPGDTIFLHSGSGDYTIGIILLNNQFLIGQGATASISDITGITVPPFSNALPATGGARPTVTTTAGDGVLLGQDNLLRGFNIGNTTGVGISDNGGTIGTLTASEVAISGSGGGIEVDNGGTLAVTLDGLSASGGSDEAIDLEGVDGTFSLVSTNGILNMTGVPAVVIDGNPTVGINLTLQSVSSINAVHGISIRDTSGSFTVNGSGAANSGGTLSGHSAEGVFLNNVSNISLSDMIVDQSATNSTQGIDATNVTGLALARTTITAGSGSSYALLGTTLRNWTATGSVFDGGGGSVANIDGTRVTNLLGTNTLTDSTFRNGKDINLLIENSVNGGGLDTITISGSSFSNSAGGDHLQVEADGSANLKLVVGASAAGNSSFSGTGQDGMQLEAEGNATLQAVLTAATIAGNLGSAVNIAAVGSGSMIARVHDLTGLSSGGTNVLNAIGFDNSNIEVTFENNTVILGGTAFSGVRVIQEGNGSVTARIANNNISGGTEEYGILVQGRAGTGGNGTLNATIDNNTVNVSGSLALDGIEVTSGSSAGGDTNTICLNMLNNNSASSNFDGYFLRQRTGSTFRLQDFAGGNVGDWITTTKGNVGTVSVSGTFVNAPAPCATPTVPVAAAPTAIGLAHTEPAGVAPATDGELIDAPYKSPEAAEAAVAQFASPGASKALFSLAASPQDAPLFSGETINLSLGLLDPGQVVRITFDVTVDNTVPANSPQVCNQGLVSGDNFADVLTDDPAVGGAIDPTCTSIEVGFVDLQVRKLDNGFEAEPGDTIQYTILFTNTGTNTATGVILTDTVPQGTTFIPNLSTADWNCPSVNAGTICTLPIGTMPGNVSSGSASFVVEVLDPLPSSFDFIINGVAIGDDGAGGPDENPADNFSVAITPVDARTDLRVRKLDNDFEAEPGDTIQYTILFTNTGTNTATGVVLTDTVPQGTTFIPNLSTADWNCPSVNAGTVCTLPIGTMPGNVSSGSVSFVVEVDDPVGPSVNFIINGVAVGDDGSGGPDENPADNFSVAITPVNAAPDLQVSKDDGVELVPPGNTIQYTIVYTNAGSRNTASTIISETVPANTTFDSANNPDGFVCNPSDGSAGANCTVDVGPVPGNGGGGSVSFAVTVDNPLPADVSETTNYVDIYDGAPVEPDANPADNSFSLATILNTPPEITGVSPAEQTVQYSDLIATVTISATDSGPDDLTLSATSLPDNLSLSSASCSTAAGGGVECTWTLSGQMLEATGTYSFDVTVSDGSLTSDPATITIVVEHEDARVTFPGSNPLSAPVISDGGDSEPFTLAVDVSEFDDPDDVVGDANLAGDISLAQVTMTLVPVGPGGPENPLSCTTSTSPGLADPDSPFDYDVLTLSCDFDALPVNTYVVEVTVGGSYYTGSGEDVLTVYDPSLGFTSGAGWFYWPGSEDPSAGYLGDRTNFGYTMKYNRRRTNIKGSLLVIRHLPDGTRYRLKSNALDGLALGSSDVFDWASISGKATYQEPNWPEPVGNHRFLVYAEDRGQPGAGADRYWLEVTGRDGNLTALSMDREAVDNAVTIQGGNIVVPHQNGPGRPR